VARVDISILREIVRVVDTRAEVPDFIDVNKRRFQINYLEDHKQRMEEALRRHDRDRLNMLFGQLESKVKYQALKPSTAKAAKDRPTQDRPTQGAPAKQAATKTAKSPAKSPAMPAATAPVAPAATPAARSRPTAAKPAARSPSRKKK